MPSEAMLIIRADLDPQEARDACTALLQQIHAEGPQLVEFDGALPNVFALQIALSCKRTLQDMDHFAGFGPVAHQALGPILDTETSLRAQV